uniref:Uncharacterized protein n=1 Tax=Calcidiscus leptoporus TaxID=127549 RepID=A0A7S0NUA3_9EUKA|mmetsp:Transcript_25768/g.60159  ORF Transcript_25768/g.60159 Transcript_25768/m.60159 type:complete len:257 (+) Transcript_25768:75-845(+)
MLASALAPLLSCLSAVEPRRAVLQRTLPLLVAAPAQALAFENRLPPDEIELKYKAPRTAGPKPTDLGPRQGNALKPCLDGKPHCFSTSREELDDNDLYNADYGQTNEWLVRPFTYAKSLAEAVDDVKGLITAYPPGQRGIDGGGFKVISETVTASSAYFYVQFESLRRGYVDDMEFALGDGVMNVRTSSRLGYLDMGVNAKRFNFFAQRLSHISGWNTALIVSKGHEEYFSLNRVADKDVLNEAQGIHTKTEKVKI